MGLARGNEIPLHADVHLVPAAPEPDAAPPFQGAGLRNFRSSQHTAEERPRLRLAPLRCRQSDMVKPFERVRQPFPLPPDVSIDETTFNALKFIIAYIFLLTLKKNAGPDRSSRLP